LFPLHEGVFVAQAAWADVQKQQRVRATAYAPAWALGGCALLLLAIGATATLSAYNRPDAAAQLLAVAAGVAICCAATWIVQVDSSSIARMRLMAVTGFLASLAVLAIAIDYLVRSPGNGGPYAGALVALLPIATLTLLHGNGWKQRAGTPAELVAWTAVAIGGVALVFSGEESALGALAFAVVIALALLFLVRAARSLLWVIGGVLLLGLFALIAWVAMGAPLPGMLADRVALWQMALPLIGDYRFTGSGPATTELIFSSYALLTHVPYVSHVHNLYLQVALEYGLIGLVALLGIYGAAFGAALQALRHGSGATQRRAGAVIAALLATLILGLVDSDVVSSLFVTALFVPPAAALLVQATARAEAHNAGILEFPARSGPAPELAARPGLWLLIATVAILPVLVIWGINALPRIQAALEANRGAVLQTQVELTDYAQADWSFQDAIRRERSAELGPAENAYRSALLLYPAQETAHRRMGQIALSLGDIPRAAGYLQEAHRLNPQNRVSAQLLGEVRALQGDADAAAALWLPLDLGQNQLDTRLNWYRSLALAEEVARMEAAVIVYTQSYQEKAAQ
jgi:O-antigen ligase